MNKRKSVAFCGVPGCTNIKTETVSLHTIPQSVKKSKTALHKWWIALRMWKPFPKNFRICSAHFDKRFILIPTKGGKVQLSTSAFPTLNLPSSSKLIRKSNLKQSTQSQKLKMKEILRNADPELRKDMQDINSVTPSFCFVDVGDTIKKSFNTIPQKTLKVTDISSLWDTDEKLNAMTGLPNFILLDALVKACSMRSSSEQSYMDMKFKILLTMLKLRSNLTFLQIGINFNITARKAKLYFSECIQLLSEVLKSTIYWPTKEQYAKNLPTCFKSFPNTVAILDCIEVKTAVFRCRNCRKITNLYCKSGHTLKAMISVTPSGLINFLSPATAGKTEKAIFASTILLENLKAGDSVMVDTRFMIEEELSKKKIEIIRPTYHFTAQPKAEIERITKISQARLFVKRRIIKLKQFKILSERLPVCLLPYVDNILTTICGFSNLSGPISKRRDL
ncbi:uncharacterized protein LOC129614252 [Condylostylus longicornis]|uniref:uncharacterized protein LOC129614252 n=1 Tax=Condylostylus longicornis TaxID=2530218 RepID=UPI00244DC150|nr:uncharacterized protein LOC129614252 [Condylostylus longicornis]XP_055384721.1 uncharacterized protein LOC129614252 [Condylostylus longicornis]XP_055384722.1 uncharacterized protein LOC129614252 [Condylostylus longicornis]XP_055384723.1 uncharacterized protein LOC129614252 [Condylostylus longicornis]